MGISQLAILRCSDFLSRPCASTTMPKGLDIIVARLLARSVAASRLASSRQVSAKVVVTVQLDRLHKRLSITGKSISLYSLFFRHGQMVSICPGKRNVS